MRTKYDVRINARVRRALVPCFWIHWMQINPIRTVMIDRLDTMQPMSMIVLPNTEMNTQYACWKRRLERRTCQIRTTNPSSLWNTVRMPFKCVLMYYSRWHENIARYDAPEFINLPHCTPAVRAWAGNLSREIQYPPDLNAGRKSMFPCCSHCIQLLRARFNDRTHTGMLITNMYESDS